MITPYILETLKNREFIIVKIGPTGKIKREKLANTVITVTKKGGRNECEGKKNKNFQDKKSQRICRSLP
jgi:hypothetical protein